MMPQGRRFLGVKSVTNSDLDKGLVPVPIIRNEHWFEKICFRSGQLLQHPLSSNPGNELQRMGKTPRMRRFPLYRA
jgi:hypothetical protein